MVFNVRIVLDPRAGAPLAKRLMLIGGFGAFRYSPALADLVSLDQIEEDPQGLMAFDDPNWGKRLVLLGTLTAQRLELALKNIANHPAVLSVRIEGRNSEFEQKRY